MIMTRPLVLIKSTLVLHGDKRIGKRKQTLWKLYAVKERTSLLMKITSLVFRCGLRQESNNRIALSWFIVPGHQKCVASKEYMMWSSPLKSIAMEATIQYTCRMCFIRDTRPLESYHMANIQLYGLQRIKNYGYPPLTGHLGTGND